MTLLPNSNVPMDLVNHEDSLSARSAPVPLDANGICHRTAAIETRSMRGHSPSSKLQPIPRLLKHLPHIRRARAGVSVGLSTLRGPSHPHPPRRRQLFEFRIRRLCNQPRERPEYELCTALFAAAPLRSARGIRSTSNAHSRLATPGRSPQYTAPHPLTLLYARAQQAPRAHNVDLPNIPVQRPRPGSLRQSTRQRIAMRHIPRPWSHAGLTAEQRAADSPWA
jgi:hypothetical protein